MQTRRTNGFTLVEALLAAVVLAIAIAAITVPFAAGARNQQAEGRISMAVGLAEQLMEEVLQRDFEEPDDGDDEAEDEDDFGPDDGETSRDQFDAIDDYHGYAEAAGAIQDSEGSTVAGEDAAGLSRHVSVAYVLVTGQDVADDKVFLRVTVEVRHEGQPMVTLTRLVHWVDND